MPNEQEIIGGALKAGLSPQQVSQVLVAYRQKNPQKSVGGFVKNVGSSAVNAVGGIGSSLINVFNPDMEKNTVANVGRLGLGAAQLLIPGEQGNEQYARQVGDFYSNRYGIGKAFKGDFKGAAQQVGDTLYQDPVGVALDASSVLGGAGALAKGVGGLTNSSTLGRVGRGVAMAGETIDPLALPGRLIKNRLGKATAGMGERLANNLDEASNTVLTKGYGQPQKLRKIEGVAGRSTGDLIRDYKLYDRSPETIGKAIDGVSDSYNTAIINSASNIDTAAFLKNLDNQIEALQSQSMLSDTAKSQMQALMERRNGIEQYLGGQSGAVPLQFSPEQAVSMKRNIYRDVKPGTYNPMYEGSGGQLAAKDAYKGLISSIDQAAPGTRQLGRDQAALIQLQELAINAEARGGARQNMNFTKLGGALAGGSVAGIPGAIGGFVAENIANSPKALQAMSTIERGGANLIRSGAPQKVASRVMKPLKPLYSGAKATRMINPSDASPKYQQPVLEQKQLTRQPSQPPNNNVTTNQSKLSLPASKYKPEALSYKPPKNPFKSSAAFGSVPKLKKSSAY